MIKLILALLYLFTLGHTSDTYLSIESRLAHANIEIGVFADRSGSIIAERTGDSTSVSYADVLAAWTGAPVGNAKASLIAPYRDSVFIHNHVYGPLTPSAQDIRFAALFNVSELRIVGIRGGVLYVCSLTRAGAYWPDYPLTPEDLRRWNSAITPVMLRGLGYGFSCV